MCLNRISQIKDTNNQLIVRYDYDIWDNRIAKTTYKDGQATTTYYFYNQDGLLAETNAQGLVTTQYGFAPSDSWQTNPLFIKTDKGYAYYHNDQLGTPRLATDKQGNILWQADYATDGKATLSPDNQIISNLRFPGQYFDTETSLHYNTRRYYDPKIGRYITQDPIGFSGGLNLYNYAGGNPVNYIDPTGEFGLIGAGIGAGLDLALQLIENGGDFKCVNLNSVLASGVMGAFTGGFVGSAKNGITGVTKVARWGRKGLQENDWVVEGGVNRFNYFRTGKWEKHKDNMYSPYSAGQSFPDIPKVASNDLRYPSPFWKYPDGGWKGLLVGQLKYSPGSLGIPAWKLDLAKNATGIAGTGAIKMEQGIGNPICGCQ